MCADCVVSVCQVAFKVAKYWLSADLKYVLFAYDVRQVSVKDICYLTVRLQTQTLSRPPVADLQVLLYGVLHRLQHLHQVRSL